MLPFAPPSVEEPQAHYPSAAAAGTSPPPLPTPPAADLDSLAGEILHCYEELHLIYDLSEALTDQLSVSTVAEIILERLLTTFRAAWSELRLHDVSQAAYTRQAGNDARATPQGGAEFELRTILRSGGHDVGAVALRRAGEAFTSGDGKLLDALGTLVGGAIHSAQLYEQLHRQAMYDALTGLPNRVLFHDRLRQGLLAARRERQPLALLVIDLDRFKEVNDTFGHDRGDWLLREMAPRLQSVLRDADTVARMGGDEFAIVLPQAGKQGAIHTALRLAEAVERPFCFENQRFSVGASIGIALHPQDGVEPEVLLQRADVAMYAAKRGGGGYALYTAEHDENSPARLELVEALRRAIALDELTLCYQPEVHLNTSTVTCLEALVRWNHPERGLLLPDEFIPFAEQTGVIRPLTQWVLDAALRQCRAWAEEGLDVPVAVNVSMRSLHDRDLPDLIASMLARWRVPAHRLILEITESSLTLDPVRAMQTLTRLANMGVVAAIDDYGTGYSSLAYVKRLPIGEIKIDRSFVNELCAGGVDAAIVRSIIQLGHDLGLTVVAEGVNDAATWRRLVELGCDTAQGYSVAAPLEAGAVAPWLHRWCTERKEDVPVS